MKKSRHNCIILGGFPFGEGHKIITLWTRDLGTVKAVAHGVRKIKNRFGSSLEFLNQLNLLLENNKNTDLLTIRESELTVWRPNLREKYEIAVWLYYYVEYLTKILQPNDPHPELFDFTTKVLNLINDNPQNITDWIRALFIITTNHLGFLPRMDRCSVCGKEFDDFAVGTVEAGWVICRECSERRYDVILNKQVLGWIQLLMRQNFRLQELGTIPKDGIANIDLFIKRFVRGIIGKELKSEALLPATGE